MSDTTPTGAPGLTRPEIGERLAQRAAETTPTAGLTIVTAWLESMPGKTRPQMSDCMALVDRIDAAIAQARREGAEAMRDAVERSLYDESERLEAAWRDEGDNDARALLRGMNAALGEIMTLPLPGDAS